MRFTCATCGAEHDLDEITFGFDEPLQWRLLTDEERAKSEIGGEQCEIECHEGHSYYIRACLEIPIQGTQRTFEWGVWCSLSERSYKEMSDHWEDPNRIKLGPYFGWLCSKLPGYPDTAFLKTMVQQRDVGIRPLVVIEPSDHPLSIDQREGIQEDRLKEMVMHLLHYS